MVYFTNIKVEIWKLNKSEEPDDYGNYKTSYTLDCVTPADFQSVETNAPDNEEDVFGKILQDNYAIFIDRNVDINDTDIFRVENQTATYSVEGTPVTNDRFVQTSHKKVVVEKQRKPTILGG